MALVALPSGIVLGAFLSTANLVLICLPGVYFARKGLVSQDMRRSLGHMSFNFLLPILTFVNIAPQLTSSQLREWWPLAVNIIVSRLVALLTGWASSRVPGTKPEHRKIVIAASAFGNTNSALLMLVTAMCTQEHLPFYEALGATCSVNGYSYVAIGLAASAFLTFPVAVALLKPRPEKDGKPRAERPSPLPKLASASSLHEVVIPEDKPAKHGPLENVPLNDAEDELGKPPLLGKPQPPPSAFGNRQAGTQRGGTLNSSVSAPVGPAAYVLSPFDGLDFQGRKAAEALAWPADGAAEKGAFERLTSINALRGMLSVCPPEDDDKDKDSKTGSCEKMNEGNAQQSAANSCLKGHFSTFYKLQKLSALREKRSVKALLWILKWFNKVAPPPTIASMLGLVVGCVPFLKNLMFPAVSAPLGFFTTALNTIADAFVFLISFILGAVLQKGPGPGTKSLGWLPILMTILNRFLFLPVLGGVWVFGSHALGWWRQPDPLFTFIMLMTNATPSGNQIQAVCAMYHTCEKECGSALFWQYMASIGGTIIWMVFYLYLMGVFGLLP